MATTDSIVTVYSSICFFCGKPAECEHHLLFGNGTEQKMKQINAWVSKIDTNNLEIQDKMVIASATMEMLEKIEAVYDKYNGSSTPKGLFK